MQSKILFFFFLFGVSFLNGNQKHTCLTLTIKNDEATILNCLNSVKDHVDCISICDFGSSDQTKALIDYFLHENNIPALFHKHESRSFAENNLIAAEAAQKTLKTYGFLPSKSFLLFLNPDQILSEYSTIPIETLTEDAYLVLEQSSALSYYSYNPNLLRASLPLDKIANLREGKFSQLAKPIAKLKTIKIEDLSTEKISQPDDKKPAQKIEQLKRNIELFTKAVKDSPENERYLLYLAQSFKSLKRYDDAISCYHSRINKGGNQEEIWFSKYMTGECHEEMGRWTDALYWYLDAYQCDSKRPEPMRKISGYYRSISHNEVAYIFAKHGIRIPFQENSTLFPMPPLYDYQFDEEISIAAFYTQFKEEGYSASNNLILRKDTPSWTKDQAYKNILFYIKQLNGVYHRIKIPLPPVEGDSDKTYSPMNPSIIKTKDGYKLICRAVNYTQVGAKHFYTPDPEGFFRTKNFLIHYDKSFNKLAQHEIIEDLTRERFNAFSVRGIEDCRLIELNQNLWFTGTTLDTNPSGAIQISLAKIDDTNAINGRPVKVEKLIPLEGPDPHRHEKNWLPFIKEEELYLIYNSYPFTIFKPNSETGECTKILEYTTEHDLSRFRGSAAPIEFDDGYLMLVHEVVFMSDYTRVYLHRFVYLDQNFRIKLLSKPFIFKQQGVEFCLSMTIDHTGKHLIMPIGIEDREAWLLSIDLEEVRSMLAPLPILYDPF